MNNYCPSVINHYQTFAKASRLIDHEPTINPPITHQYHTMSCGHAMFNAPRTNTARHATPGCAVLVLRLAEAPQRCLMRQRVPLACCWVVKIVVHAGSTCWLMVGIWLVGGGLTCWLMIGTWLVLVYGWYMVGLLIVTECFVSGGWFIRG